MFYLRLNQVTIVDNHKTAFPIFGHDRIEVQLISFVTTGNIDLPNLDEFIKTTDAARKQQLLAGYVANVVGSRILTPIANVTDDFTATFGDAGYAMYESNTIPDSVNWEFLAIRVRDATRNVGQELDKVVNDSQFGSFASNLATLLVGAANPTFTAGVAIAKFVLNFAAKGLEQTPDDQIGLFYETLVRQVDYPHGERKRDDVVDLTGNLYVDYSLFGV